MSRYRFQLKDYHAVKEADILIDGITVLAGVNSSGKSTVLRWLDYTVRILNEFPRMMEWKGIRNFVFISHRIERALTGMRISDSEDTIFELLSLADDIQSSKIPFDAALDKIRRLSRSFIELLATQINKSDFQTRNLKRILSSFNLREDENLSPLEYVRLLSEKLEDEITNVAEEVARKKGNFNAQVFTECVPLLVDRKFEGNKLNLNLSFDEDGVALLDSEIYSQPLNLLDAIFIKSDEIVKYTDKNPFEKNLLFEQLTTSNPKFTDTVDRILIRKIRSIIEGNAVADRDEYSADDENLSLYYVRDDNLRIPLRAAATGIISFSYILRLLENGWLNRNSILIIDEPDAHLHPMWIVEFARMMVLINKTMGTKIVISSHNPDMVSAIRAIANKHGILEDTHFYIAETSEDSQFMYEYRNLGYEIGEIFDSFNIALERMDLYGKQD